MKDHVSKAKQIGADLCLPINQREAASRRSQEKNTGVGRWPALHSSASAPITSPVIDAKTTSRL